MTVWAISAAVYGAILAGAALVRPIRRRLIVVTAAVAYSLVAIGSATLPASVWIELTVPAGLLLTGYWLSGFFFRDPQPWLEAFLVGSDARLFRSFAINRWLAASPAWALELLEATYAADYAVIAFGAIVTAAAGVGALANYWSLVLTSELACYAALPWLRSRPPRALEPAGILAERSPVVRRLNMAILDRASVQANTVPSGHVAGAVAAGLGVWAVSPGLGVVLLATAALIGVAAVAGRYHYVADCAAGAAVAIIVGSFI